MLNVMTRWFKKPSPARPARRAVLGCEALEAREVPAGIFIAGVGGITQAADPEVSLYATSGPRQNQRIGSQLEAFPGTTGDTRIAYGDINADGTDDIVAASGKGGSADVVIFDGKAALAGTRSELARFNTYVNFAGGVFVAAADLNGDGFAEVMTTPGLGGRGHLKVFDFNSGNGSPAAPLGTGAFLGSSPALRTSAYTFTDYNGEIRIATMRVGGAQFVVTSSGAGVPSDVRAFRNAYTLGAVGDGTAVPSQFLAGRVVPFGGFSGGVSVSAGDTDGDGNDELFVSKNSGPADVEVHTAAITGTGAGQGSFSLVSTFEAFAGFNGEVRLGAGDVDGDGKVEVLTTTGFSGDPQGTPVKAWSRSGTAFNLVRSFFSNPGYQPGAWLGGKDFTYSTDLTNPGILDNGAAGALPAVFTNRAGNPDTFTNAEDVHFRFPATGEVPAEAVTGAGLRFKDLELSFSFTHTRIREATVTLVYDDGVGANRRTLTLYNGPGAATAGRTEVFSGLQATFTDNAPGTIPAGTAGQQQIGRFQADGGSIGAFVRGLPTRTGYFFVVFEDGIGGDDGTVNNTVPPRLRLLY